MNAVVVTGDRYAKRDVWANIVDRALRERAGNGRLIVVHGNADGIDAIADSCTTDLCLMDAVPVPARWKQDGKAAGPLRNSAMLSVLDTLRIHGYRVAVLAFHDDLGGSKGTRDMVNQALRAGIETWLHTTYADPKQIAKAPR